MQTIQQQMDFLATRAKVMSHQTFNMCSNIDKAAPEDIEDVLDELHHLRNEMQEISGTWSPVSPPLEDASGNKVIDPLQQTIDTLQMEIQKTISLLKSHLRTKGLCQPHKVKALGTHC